MNIPVEIIVLIFNQLSFIEIKRFIKQLNKQISNKYTYLVDKLRKEKIKPFLNDRIITYHNNTIIYDLDELFNQIFITYPGCKINQYPKITCGTIEWKIITNLDRETYRKEFEFFTIFKTMLKHEWNIKKIGEKTYISKYAFKNIYYMVKIPNDEYNIKINLCFYGKKNTEKERLFSFEEIYIQEGDRICAKQQYINISLCVPKYFNILNLLTIHRKFKKIIEQCLIFTNISYSLLLILNKMESFMRITRTKCQYNNITNGIDWIWFETSLNNIFKQYLYDKCGVKYQKIYNTDICFNTIDLFMVKLQQRGSSYLNMLNKI